MSKKNKPKRPRPARPTAQPRPLTELAGVVEGGGILSDRDLAPYLRAARPELRSAGYQIQSKNHYNTGLVRTQESMETANLIEGFANPTLLMNLMKVCDLRGDMRGKFRYLVRFAASAADRQDDALALETLMQACVLDFSVLSMANCSRRDTIEELAGIYGKIAAGQQQRKRFQTPMTVSRRRPLRIAHVVPNLVDLCNSPTKVLRNFVTHADREQFELRLYTTEVLTKRDKPAFAMHQITPPTPERAPETLKFLLDHDCPYWIAPVDGDFAQSAHRLAEQMARDRVDVALYHSSLATSIDCLTAHLRPTPLAINLCIGLPMYADTIDAIVYFIQATRDRDLDFWEARGIDAPYVQGGIDQDEFANAKPLDRAQLGIPQQAVILGTVGNHLPGRMGAAFCRTVAGMLKRHAHTLYFIVGRGDFTRQKQVWQQEGVLERVVFLGARGDVPRFTKTFDVYLNEFPGGGGMSVLEAMAAGRPVVALKSGNDHLGACGVEYVGPEHGIMTNDPARYAALADRLIADPAFREQVGRDLFRRYEDVYAGRHLTAKIEQVVLDLVDRHLSGRRHVA